MIRRIFWEAAACLSLIALATLGPRILLALEKQPIVYIEAPLGRPIICDATVQQCTTSYKCQRPKCYVRRDK